MKLPILGAIFYEPGLFGLNDGIRALGWWASHSHAERRYTLAETSVVAVKPSVVICPLSVMVPSTLQESEPSVKRMWCVFGYCGAPNWRDIERDKAGPTGLEPVASAVTGLRGSQFLYGPKLLRCAPPKCEGRAPFGGPALERTNCGSGSRVRGPPWYLGR